MTISPRKLVFQPKVHINMILIHTTALPVLQLQYDFNMIRYIADTTLQIHTPDPQLQLPIKLTRDSKFIATPFHHKLGQNWGRNLPDLYNFNKAGLISYTI